ncbi:MAG: hypothetical protein IPH78_12765 [Bacteroidetes bacterium]|nr:hypothetical protein [Bacteroidota bacterium]
MRDNKLRNLSCVLNDFGRGAWAMVITMVIVTGMAMATAMATGMGQSMEMAITPLKKLLKRNLFQETV